MSKQFYSFTSEINANSNHNDHGSIKEKTNGNQFGEVYVILPSSWANQPDCLHGRNVTEDGSKILFNEVEKYHPDFILESPHPIFGSEPWSDQFGGCTVQGQGVRVPYTLLTELEPMGDEVIVDRKDKIEKYVLAGIYTSAKYTHKYTYLLICCMKFIVHSFSTIF